MTFLIFLVLIAVVVGIATMLLNDDPGPIFRAIGPEAVAIAVVVVVVGLALLGGGV